MFRVPEQQILNDSMLVTQSHGQYESATNIESLKICCLGTLNNFQKVQCETALKPRCFVFEMSENALFLKLCDISRYFHI